MLKFGDTYLKYGDTYLMDWTSEKKYNPLNLPPYTIRLLYKDGTTPTFRKGAGVRVSSSPNIWDLTYENSDWSALLESKINPDHIDLLEVLGANTKGVTNMSHMFRACRNLESIMLFDTSEVTTMTYMLSECNYLTNVPLFDTSNVTDMSWMFSVCTHLDEFPLFDTTNVTTMSGMFERCILLISVPLFNTSNVTDMSWMFSGCTSLTSMPLLDTSNVTVMSYMFSGCTDLIEITLFDTSKVDNMMRTFENCNNVRSGALALYKQLSTQAVPPTYHFQTFANCGINTTTGAAELAQIPSGWK